MGKRQILSGVEQAGAAGRRSALKLVAWQKTVFAVSSLVERIVNTDSYEGLE